MTNLAETVRDAVREHADATAVTVAGSETSYAEFWALTGRFAGALRERGVGAGDRIAVYLPNLPQFLVAYYGILRVGGVVVPIDPRYEADWIKPILAHSTSGAIVTTNDRVPEVEKIHEHTLLQFIVTADGPGDYSTGFTEFLRESPDIDYWSVADRAADDVAVLTYTTGVTDDPKGVLLTHGNLTSNATTVADLPPDGLDPSDAALAGLSLFHTFGMTVVMNAPLASGATVVPMRSWDAGTALERIDDEELSVFAGTPAMFQALADHPAASDHSLESLRFTAAGGAPLAGRIRETFETQFDATIRQGYGLTEASPVTHFDRYDDDRRPGSIGQPVAGVSARVVNDSFEERPLAEDAPLSPADASFEDVVGEIVVAGPNVMKQYHEHVEVNAAAFTGFDGEQWLHTGDLGYVDSEGYFYFIDRKADVFSVDGETVYPRMGETTLEAHEAVAEAGVVGVTRVGDDERDGDEGDSDERDGDKANGGASAAVAFVVPTAEGDASAEELTEHWVESDDETAYPRAVEVVTELSKTTTGKLLRRELQARASDLEVDAVLPESADEGLDDLQDLDGISESRAATLSDAGYERVADLEAASREDLAEIEGFGNALADRIKRQLEDDGKSQAVDDG